MTGIFGARKRNPQIPPERCFFPSACQSSLSPPTAAARAVHATATLQKSLASAHGWDEVWWPPFDLCVCVCVCVLFYACAPSNLTRWIQRGNAGWSQRDTPCGNCWRLCSSNGWLERPCKQYKHVLQASVSKQTRPPVSLLDHLRTAFKYTPRAAALFTSDQAQVSSFNGYH